MPFLVSVSALRVSISCHWVYLLDLYKSWKIKKKKLKKGIESLELVDINC
jgi:hypothetical protein